jgi:hypothetical protein
MFCRECPFDTFMRVVNGFYIKALWAEIISQELTELHIVVNNQYAAHLICFPFFY